MQEASINYFYDVESHRKWRIKRGIDPDFKYVLTSTKRGAMYYVALEEAIRNQLPIHEHINPGTPSEKTKYGRYKRMSLNNLSDMMNWMVDSESPDDPIRSYSVTTEYVKTMTKEHYYPKNQDIEKTYAGTHIISGIKKIHFSDDNDRNIVKKALSGFFNDICQEHWDNANRTCGYTKENGLYVPATFCDLPHPAAPAGSNRIAGNKKNDNHVLANYNFCRGWLFPTDYERPIGNKVSSYILRYKKNPPKTTSELYEMQVTYSTDLLERYFLNDIDRYIFEWIPKEKPGLDRTTTMVMALYHLAKEFWYSGEEYPREKALMYAEYIHNLVGKPHNTTFEAVRQATYAIRKWQPLTKDPEKEKKRYVHDIILEPEKKKIEVHSSDEQKQTFHEWTDTFISLDKNAFTPVEKVLYQYQQWCKRLGKEEIGERQFSLLMGEKFKVIRKLKSINGEKIRCYFGLQLSIQIVVTDFEEHKIQAIAN